MGPLAITGASAFEVRYTDCLDSTTSRRSCGTTLDRFGWKHWEIREGLLYCNELSYRYHWSPAQLVAPLWGITEPHLALPNVNDNLTSLESARRARKATENASEPEIAVPARK